MFISFKIVTFVRVLTFLILSYSLSVKLSSHECIAFDKVKTILEGHPQKPISVVDNSITLESAYCVQEKLNFLINRKYNDKIGYKVGFTGKATQKMFEINTPAIGTLYKHMFVENAGSLNYDFGFRPLIEPDLMVIVKSKDIMKAKSNMEILKELESIHPYVEIASLRFEKGTKITGNMLVAANMLATKMVIGEGVKVEPNTSFMNKINSLQTIFKKADGDIIQKAPVSNLMGNPLNVMSWLIAYLNEKKILLKKGDRISLGSVGKLYPIQKDTSYVYILKGLDKDISLKININ